MDIFKQIEKYGDTEADYLLLRQAVYWILSVIGVITSLLILVIWILYPIISALEIAYINISIFEYKINDNMGENNLISKGYHLIFRNAIKAAQECERDITKNKKMVYLKIKIIDTIIVMLPLTLLCGGMSAIIDIVKRLINI